ncbi:hypothetical protein LguiA_016647 [Lonicera macranthoides]
MVAIILRTKTSPFATLVGLRFLADEASDVKSPGDLDEKMSDALHSHIEEQGINESLFPFLQAWLYVKDHRKLMHCFKSMATFINEDMHGYDA